MDFKEIFKKFWFVILVAVLFVGFIIAYSVNTIQNREVVKEPVEIDGQYIIYSINDQNYTADQLYDELKNTYGLNSIYTTYDRLISDKAVETTKEMKDIAANNAAYLLQYYGEEELTAQMQKLGYKDASEATDYYIYLLKSQQLRRDYLKAHMEEYVLPYAEAHHPKMISHILVKVADVQKIENEDGTYTFQANPTEEEKAKLDEVLKALETESFEQVAVEYSEDGSAQNGGFLGYFDDKNTTYVKEFADAAKTLTNGQISDVVVSEYGYHILMCNTDDINLMMDDIYSVDLLNAIFAENGDLYNVPLLEKAEELGVKINDEKLNNQLMQIIGGTGEETPAENESEVTE